MITEEDVRRIVREELDRGRTIESTIELDWPAVHDIAREEIVKSAPALVSTIQESIRRDTRRSGRFKL